MHGKSTVVVVEDGTSGLRVSKDTLATGSIHVIVRSENGGPATRSAGDTVTVVLYHRLLAVITRGRGDRGTRT